MLQRCDAGACRLRARDLGLGDGDGAAGACLGRCDGPVAAERDGRVLTLVARGRVEPWSSPPLPRQPAPPVVLRDAGLPDQPLEAAARRRGAYAALDKVTAMQARELVAAVTGGYGAASWRGAGAFAERVLRDRDPHLVREGEAIAERAGARVDAVTAARLVRAAQHGVDWLERHATILCALSGDVLRPGLYELGSGATIAEALAAAGGVVDGVRVATAGTLVADGAATTDLAAPAPAALIALHAARDPIC